MTNPEQHPDQPDRERIPDNELDLTGVIDQPDLLHEVIYRAIASTDPRDEVPAWGARAMARYLANLLPDRDASALHTFAATGAAAYDRLRHEIRHLRSEAESGDTIGIAMWLGSYLRSAEVDDRRETEASYPVELRRSINELGPAFAAFLLLPDVPSTQDARDLFQNAYFATYDSLDAIAVQVVEDLDLAKTLAESGVAGIASLDIRKVLELALMRWDIVPYEGKYYLFEK
ncbi:hypothetical protein [Tsukamurella tyrosinosolvens]|uniref:hypothetical protein n=1 Tax=Tsukamurella tyrosinosolvens TaxID=57704 RepID=UPI00079C27C3|nr:hypothetical protein [Tsukamurella tyrosinosolvens]KXP06898.1 hypothetical protein AXK59_01935 [Tsukamurella tyrosinosolvens]